jgi:hypothetical protein
MLAAEQEPSRSVRALETLSFLLLDRMNRRACLELRALDILLDILRRATDQQVLLSALEAVCSLCKHDARDKVIRGYSGSGGYAAVTSVAPLRRE